MSKTKREVMITLKLMVSDAEDAHVDEILDYLTKAIPRACNCLYWFTIDDDRPQLDAIVEASK